MFPLWIIVMIAFVYAIYGLSTEVIQLPIVPSDAPSGLRWHMWEEIKTARSREAKGGSQVSVLKALFGDDRPLGHATRRSPGAWQRRRLVFTGMALLVLDAALFGALISAWAAHWFSIEWVLWSLLAALVVLGIACWWVWNHMTYSTKNLEKGLEAECRTGEVIEYALTSPNCAVAHNVSGIGSGDIDHLAVTPHTVWVIDSKFSHDDRWLDDKIAGVARQVRAVERWTEGAKVRGCIAFLTGFDGEPEEHRATDGTPILCLDINNGLVKALHDDMRRPGKTIDKALIERVWKRGSEREPANK